MTKRPLKDIRPIGPLVQPNRFEQQEVSSEEIDEESNESKLVEQAENWYESISDEGTKRKMMIEYINGITDDSVSRSDAEKIVSNSGI